MYSDKLKQSLRSPKKQNQLNSNNYFDTYQKMNNLMSTLQHTQRSKIVHKPSLKASAMRGSGLDSMFGNSNNNSQLAREIAIQRMSSRESAIGDEKMNVTFNIAKPPAINTNSTSSSVAAFQKQIQMQKIQQTQNSPIKRLGETAVTRNFQRAAKQSYQNQLSRHQNMTNTLDSFFDKNKIYLKSVQQEATFRARKRSTEDSLYEDPPPANKQAF